MLPVHWQGSGGRVQSSSTEGRVHCSVTMDPMPAVIHHAQEGAHLHFSMWRRHCWQQLNYLVRGGTDRFPQESLLQASSEGWAIRRSSAYWSNVLPPEGTRSSRSLFTAAAYIEGTPCECVSLTLKSESKKVFQLSRRFDVDIKKAEHKSTTVQKLEFKVNFRYNISSLLWGLARSVILQVCWHLTSS